MLHMTRSQNTSKKTQSSLTTLYSLISLISLISAIAMMGVGCADVEDMEDMSAEKSGYGASEYLYYSCETATIAPTGSKWVYQTDEIMNLMDKIQLRVIQDGTDYGPQTLTKIATDTFSDNNLTVKLVQQASGKSIEVQHANMSLFASAANGWCSVDNRAPSGAVLPTPGENTTYDTFKVEAEAECVNPCTFGLSTNMQIASVIYEVDGWRIGESNNALYNFSISYTFNTLGARRVKAHGVDQYGNVVASDSRDFVVKQDPSATPAPAPAPTPGNQPSTSNSGSARGEVPYYYQYNNSLHPGASCQNTSIAMVLSHLGASITPDDITRRFGKDAAQSVGGLNSVFNQLAGERGVRRINSTSTGTFSELRSALDQGSPVIIHGFFTGYGHVIVVTGYDANGYYVNDPAGMWSQVFKGGYSGSSSTAGKNAYYRKSAFEAAVGTYDGSTYAPLWMHYL